MNDDEVRVRTIDLALTFGKPEELSTGDTLSFVVETLELISAERQKYLESLARFRPGAECIATWALLVSTAARASILPSDAELKARLMRTSLSLSRAPTKILRRTLKQDSPSDRIEKEPS